MRALAPMHGDLAKRLAELDEKIEASAAETRNHLKQVFEALREPMAPPDPPKRPIGFINPEDKGSKKTSGARLKT